MKPTTVFISYSHDSDDHRKRVRALADGLRGRGIDATIDLYEPNPPEGWPLWMERHLRDSRFILVVCTQTYYRRFTAQEKDGEGKGVRWEAMLARNFIYGNLARNERFIPVVFSETDGKYVPEVLQGFTVYNLSHSRDYEDLCRRLTGENEEGRTEEKTRTPVSSPDIDISRLPLPGKFFVGREAQMRELNRCWFETETPCRVVSVIAWGGVGKSALTHRWVMGLIDSGSHGAEDIFAWSFYSQGAGEGKQTSADLFFQVALERFGDPDPKAGSAVDRGRRLAKLLAKRRALLILDGLEPLQYPANDRAGLAGKLKDTGISAMLKDLAVQNRGLWPHLIAGIRGRPPRFP